MNRPGKRMVYFEDAGQGLDFEEARKIRETEGFQPLTADVPNFGFRPSAYWLYFRLKNAGATERWFLQIKYAPLDHVELYQRRNQGNWQHSETGDTLPFDRREIAHRTFVFRMDAPPDSETEVYIRVQTEGSAIVPVEIMPDDLFHAADHEQQIALGLYYGILLVLTIYNLILFFIVRERAYLYYLLYITGFGIFQMNLNGLSFEYLWPNLPGLNNHILPFSIGWGFLWGLLFAMELLDTRRNAPALHRYLQFLSLPFIALIAVTFFPGLVGYHLKITFGAALLIFFGVSVFLTGLRVWIRGFRPARYFVIAWGTFVLGMVLYALKSFGVIPSNAFTENGMQIGSAIEMSLLSLGLADRMLFINQEKEEARQRAQEASLRVARYQFELLKKSIQPHFILNSLNATAVWLKEDPNQAAKLLYALADELRQILGVVEKPLIPIENEIELCRTHLQVMNLRQDRTYTLSVKNIRSDEQVPPMIFHTLIENGITHGFANRPGGGRFILARQRGRDRIRYILFNNGESEHDNDKIEGSGMGLRYLQTRLEEAWPGRWCIKQGGVRGGWRVVIDVFDQTD